MRSRISERRKTKNDRGTLENRRTQALSSAKKNSPTEDDDTVLHSNCGLDVNKVPDDNPATCDGTVPLAGTVKGPIEAIIEDVSDSEDEDCSMGAASAASAKLCNVLTVNEEPPALLETVDDGSSVSSDEGREQDEFLAVVNSIKLPKEVWVPVPDIEMEAPELPPEADAPIVDYFDGPDTVRAQIDTGAFVSCTDQLHMIHDYQAFSAKFPCPVRLQPATEGSDATPEGFGYFHVPAHNEKGFLAVRVFYHPALRATVIDERDL